MGAALNMASASNAYVLSDRGTWLAFQNRGDLVIAVEGDKRLFNQYGVMLVNSAKCPSVKKDLGQQFIDFLISPEGAEDHRRIQDQRPAAFLSERKRPERIARFVRSRSCGFVRVGFHCPVAHCSTLPQMYIALS